MTKIVRIVSLVVFVLGILCNNLYAFEQDVYIWQKSWDEGIHDSLKQIAPQTDKFSVLAAMISVPRGRPVFSKVNINLSYLHDVGKPAVLAVRMLSSCGKLVNTDKVNSIADQAVEAIRSLIEDAVMAGVKIDGVQFDYDSPTSKLPNYGQFLSRVQSRYPGLSISITTLPSWMDSPAFSDLVKPLSFYVLQLHSLETPKTSDEKFLLFDIGRSRRYVDQSLKLGKKFFISLPTYGYETAFDSKGKFIGLRAENRRVRWADDVQLKVVMADPDAVADFFQEIKGMPASALSGVYWFRLPVKDDELNWGVKTMQVIMSGQIPRLSLKAEVMVSQDGATEVYLENPGEKDFGGKVAFDIFWNSEERPLFDLMSAYAKQDLKGGKGIHITGPAPKVGGRSLVAWFRNVRKEAGVLEINTTKVVPHDDKDGH
jgi:hypothetical protein